ncbi:hypothetical protein B0H12DRAFT_1072523 [Mycena haematopus]|nr:hypothetical protein B0H12DRAFT_1082636 [Mycena haematopus]KAJ7249154.1 hypothetical protein B0H12DRAFT_1072523 [Mycena haematopus]
MASILTLPTEITQRYLFLAWKDTEFDWAKASDRRSALSFALGHTARRPLSILLLAREFSLAERPLGFKLDIPVMSMSNFAKKTIPMLNDYYGRMKHLTLDCGALHILESLWQILGTKDLSALERLSITIKQPARAGPRLFLQEIAAPTHPMRLIELRLSGAPIFWPEPGYYSALTSLRLCNLTERRAMPWSAFATMLKNTTGLQLLQLSLVEWTDVSGDVQDIRLPVLTDLHVKFADAMFIIPLSRISMPAVNLLHLHIINDDLEDFVSMFGSALQRIRTLKIRLVTTNRSHWEGLMHALGDLEELDVCRNHRDVIEYLIDVVTTDNKNCPNLGTLVVACDIGYEERDALFKAFRPGFRLIRRKHSRSKEVQSWDGVLASTDDTVEYIGASIAHQWAAKEKRPLHTL